VNIVTRFAPSPTGYLHIGGARTALFCFLYARRHSGEFLLRIEDTDRVRSTPESVQAIFDGMEWLGLESDRVISYQSQRAGRYTEVIAQLLASGHAYYCYCSKADLERRREAQIQAGEKPRYDGRCRDLGAPPEGITPIVRFRTPHEGQVVTDDLVRGRVVVDNAELDDLVIARGDGVPTYNLAVVVDDMDMGISHVIRGDDHLNNTPRQIHIYRALGATPPLFAHVPMILGADGARMSKRHGAVSVMQYRGDGILPQALLNYLVRLGWSHGDQEIFTMKEMIDLFDIADVNRAPASFDPDKLRWLNHHYIKTLPEADILPELAWQFERLQIDVSQGPTLSLLLGVQRDRCATLRDMAQQSRFLYQDFEDYDPAAAKKHLRGVAAQPLQAVLEALRACTQWDPASLAARVQGVAQALDIGMGKVGMPLRVAISGGGQSPAIGDTLAMLGAEKSLLRIERALEYISARVNGNASSAQ